MTRTLRDRFATPQGSQAASFEDEVAELLERHGKRFSELEASTQRKLEGHASDIAKLSDDLADVRKKSGERFRALADHYARGGAYTGINGDIETARDLGRFVRAAVNRDEALMRQVSDRASLGTGTGSGGGFMMPETFIASIIRNVESFGYFEADALVQDVDTQTGRWSKQNTGATVYHPDFGSGPTESTLKLDAVQFNCTRYSALVIIDRWMLSPGLEAALGDYVNLELAHAIASAQDKYGFVGDGTKTTARVLGMLNQTTANGINIVDADSGDNTFAEVIAASSKYPAALLGALPDWAETNGESDAIGDVKFYMHRTIFFGYLGTRDTQGRPIADIFRPGERGARPVKMLFGYEARTNSHLPKLADTAASKIMLAAANLRRGWGIFRDRRGIEFRQSEHVKFVEGQLAMLIDVLEDIVPLDLRACALLKTAAS